MQPAGRPVPTRRDPAPVGPVGGPVAGPPAIAGVVIAPVAGDVEIILARGRSAGADIDAGRRRIAVLEVRYVGADPEARHALPASLGFRPIGRNPAHARGRHAPQAADPDVILSGDVPFPVAGNPDRPFRFEIGSDLVDRFRRLFGHHRRRLGFSRRRSGERLVNRTASQCFHPLHLNAFRRLWTRHGRQSSISRHRRGRHSRGFRWSGLLGQEHSYGRNTNSQRQRCRGYARKSQCVKSHHIPPFSQWPSWLGTSERKAIVQRPGREARNSVTGAKQLTQTVAK